MAGGLTLSEDFARRVLAAVRWVERQAGRGVGNQRGRRNGGDPFERVLTDADLVSGGNALGTIMIGSSSTGWSQGTEQIRVYEDGMIEAADTIPSGTAIHVKWMHGVWVLDDVRCTDIDS